MQSLNNPLPDLSASQAGEAALDQTVALAGSSQSEPVQTRVLVVDDSPQNLAVIATSLERLGYLVTLAENGRDALHAVAASAPDVVLLDILLPDVSGMEVLRTLRSCLATADLPVILISGLDDSQDIVQGLELGANDYVTKPINLPVLQARLAAHTALKRARDELKRTALLLAAELDQNARELQVAGQVQGSILPRVPPESETIATAWCYEPARRVSGDLFDVVPLSRGRMLLFVADAMGHGVQAALVVSAVKATLAAHLNEVDDLPILMGLIDLAIGDLFDDRYVTAAACLLDPSEGRLRYVVAGHPPILLATSSGIEALEEGGLPLGTHLELTFEGGERPLRSGDRLLLYSDGLTEAERLDGGQFGLDPVLASLAREASSNPASIIQAIRAALHRECGPGPLRDDLTILAATVR